MTNLCNVWNLRMGRMALGLALVGITPAVTAQENFGTIKGRLVWGGAEVPKQVVVEEQGKAKKDPEVCAKNAPILSKELVVDPKTKGVAHGFAYLVRPKGVNPKLLTDLLKKNPKVEIDQKFCEFAPHCTAINKDQVLIFKSSDPCSHNVRYAGFKNDAFNQNIPPNQSVERNLVAENLPIPVKCDIHPWMQSYVMVYDHPFFAVTKEDGSFEIKGVPAGAQKIVLWQEKIGFVTPNRAAGKPIEVKAGEVLDLGEITMGK
jgi:hypothetical protein